jgi:hypothetical protein
MLINKGITPGEVVTVKTSAGEEILAKLVEETATGIKLSKPLCLTATQKGVGLVPFLFTVDPDTEIVLNRNTVTVIAPTTKEFADTYIENTTGIKLA